MILFALLFQILSAQEFNIQQAKSIEVLATNLNLEVVSGTETKLRWLCADKKCKIKPSLKDGKLVVHVESNEKVKLKVPQLPLHIYVKHLTLSLQNWQQDLKLRGMNVTANIANTKGVIDINESLARLKIQKHSGEIKIDAFDGKVQIANSKAALTISQFTGLIGLAKVDGNIQVTTQNADTLIKDSQGKLRFKSAKGQLNVASFKGDIYGESKDGRAELSPLAKSTIHWKADRGEVMVDMQNMSGAKIDVGSLQGKMQLIPSLKIATEGTWRVARAKPLNSEQGAVLVRTNKASIRMSSE